MGLKASANAQIGKRLFQKALDGDTASLIWWTKTQMGWTETQKHIIENTDEMRVAGRPIADVREETLRRLDAVRAKLMPSDN